MLDSTLPTASKSRAIDQIAARPGFAQYRIASEFQRGPNTLTVLAPRELIAGRRYPVVYFLPVEAGADEDGARWGTALRAADGLAEHYQAICAVPSFDTWPWYGDHATDPTIRHESYLIRVVLPFIEGHYPTLGKPLLLGFSKSGWGAVSLLLRYPEVFARAAAWDAPLMMDWRNPFGNAGHFGDETSFRRCHIPTLLARRTGLSTRQTGSPHRLILTGYAAFRDQLLDATALLDRLGIPHVPRDGPWRAHHWESGWVPEAMELLMDGREG